MVSKISLPLGLITEFLIFMYSHNNKDLEITLKFAHIPHINCHIYLIFITVCRQNVISCMFDERQLKLRKSLQRISYGDKLKYRKVSWFHAICIFIIRKLFFWNKNNNVCNIGEIKIFLYSC